MLPSKMLDDSSLYLLKLFLNPSKYQLFRLAHTLRDIIIPAIDIIDGKCVRLSKGDYNTKKEYSNKPLEVAQQFEAAGITHLHLVDLDGANLIANDIAFGSTIEKGKVLLSEKVGLGISLK